VLLGYYDRLYDKHVANATGTGSGTGERSGALLEALHTETGAFDGEALASEVLRRVYEFDGAA